MMRIPFPHRKIRTTHAVVGAFVILFGVVSIRAQVVIAPVKPVIGSANTVTAEPRIAVPETKSCTVTLFQNLEFDNFNTQNFTYTPPSGCRGPWAKVVFSADFTVTEGIQYDRTAQFFLGGANIFFGTTAEPAPTLSPSWHVERDVTDLSSLLNSPQAGTALLGNIVNSQYTGIIYANAQLTFYEPSWKSPAPSVPSIVIGMPGNTGAAILNTPTSVYTQTVTLPTNVTSAYLDVTAQSQINDEFWYTCVPNSLATELESCGGTSFRETEITVDGKPAGVAPVYPWIYTGGIDPFLWQPLPGVQTLNFVPFRVDLTPFAGLLSNGAAHSIGIQVYNANGYFQATGNLLVYTDPVMKKVEGGLDVDTLAAEPTPVITNNINTSKSGTVTGSVFTVSNRIFTIAGHVTTSHGTVKTTVVDTVDFSQKETFDITASQDVQDIVQTTKVAENTETAIDGFTLHQTASYTYPFTLDYGYFVNADGTSYQTAKTDQQDLVNQNEQVGWLDSFATNLSNQVVSQDTLHFDASGNFTGNTGNSSWQDYVARDSEGGCYSEKLTSAKGVLTGAARGAACR